MDLCPIMPTTTTTTTTTLTRLTTAYSPHEKKQTNKNMEKRNKEKKQVIIRSDHYGNGNWHANKSINEAAGSSLTHEEPTRRLSTYSNC